MSPNINMIVRATRILVHLTRSLKLIRNNRLQLTWPTCNNLLQSVHSQRHFSHTTYYMKDASDDKSRQPGKNDRTSDSDSSSEDSSSSSSSDDDEVDPKLTSAAEDVAKSLPGDAEKTKSDLLSKLREHVTLTNQQKQGKLPPTSLRSLVGSMKTVQKQKKKKVKDAEEKVAEDDLSEMSTMEEYDRLAPRRMRKRDQEPRSRAGGAMEEDEGRGRRQGKKFRKDQRVEELDIFNSPPLGIFGVVRKKQPATEQELSLFDRIQKELDTAEMTYPPRNAFEQWSRWTKQGKMWKYPIDNEQGMEEEATVGFHEHVFLDQLLVDFPKRGPVRHFMELVVNGLSKNPYLTVSQKKEHIEWYKQYFSDKYKLIEEMTITASNPKVESKK